jgi:hypothetical protein
MTSNYPLDVNVSTGFRLAERWLGARRPRVLPFRADEPPDRSSG